MGFDPYNYFPNIQKSIWTPTPNVGVGSVNVHFLTLSYTPGNMRCDS
jgi:hypothetical protein